MKMKTTHVEGSTKQSTFATFALPYTAEPQHLALHFQTPYLTVLWTPHQFIWMFGLS